MHREYYFTKPRLVKVDSTGWRERIKHVARHTVKATEMSGLADWLGEMRTSLSGPLWA